MSTSELPKLSVPNDALAEDRLAAALLVVVERDWPVLAQRPDELPDDQADITDQRLFAGYPMHEDRARTPCGDRSTVRVREREGIVSTAGEGDLLFDVAVDDEDRDARR